MILTHLVMFSFFNGAGDAGAVSATAYNGLSSTPGLGGDSISTPEYLSSGTVTTTGISGLRGDSISSESYSGTATQEEEDTEGDNLLLESGDNLLLESGDLLLLE